MPRLALFAFTGTLLDERSEYAACDATMGAVRERFPVDLSPAELSGRFTLALMEIMRGEPAPEEPAEFLPLYDTAPEVFAGLMVSLGFQVSAAEKAWFAQRYRADLRKHARLHRDARTALPRLAEEGWRLGVVTDADPRLVADVLDPSPLGALLPVRVSASESGHVKPHPASFRLALEKADVAPGDAVAVGASFERDVVAAQEAELAAAVLLDRHDARTVDVPRVRSLTAFVRLARKWKA